MAAEVGLELIQDQRDINEVNNDNASSGHTRTTSSGEETEVAMEGGEGNSSTSKLYVVGMRGHVITGFYDPMSRLRDLNNPYSTLSSQSQGTVRGEGSEGEMVKDCLYIDPFEPHELMTATQVSTPYSVCFDRDPDEEHTNAIFYLCLLCHIPTPFYTPALSLTINHM